MAMMMRMMMERIQIGIKLRPMVAMVQAPQVQAPSKSDKHPVDPVFLLMRSHSMAKPAFYLKMIYLFIYF